MLGVVDVLFWGGMEGGVDMSCGANINFKQATDPVKSPSALRCPGEQKRGLSPKGPEKVVCVGAREVQKIRLSQRFWVDFHESLLGVLHGPQKALFWGPAGPPKRSREQHLGTVIN